MASYNIKSKQKLLVNVGLTIEIKMTPAEYDLVLPLPEHLKPTRLWQSDDPEIIGISR